MTALPSSFYQIFGANSQDRRRRGHHLLHERKVNVQLSNDRDESSRRSKTRPTGCPQHGGRDRKAQDRGRGGGARQSDQPREVCRHYGLSANEFLFQR